MLEPLGPGARSSVPDADRACPPDAARPTSPTACRACDGRPVRRRVVHAHLRHHRPAEVLRADARLLPSAWPRAMAGALELTPARPGARPAAAVPHQPDGLRHHHRAAHRRRRAHRRASSPPAASGRRWSTTRVTVLILHAPPVEILKRATTAEDAAGHRVRTMFYADREFLRPLRHPAAVSGYGSTEAGGVSPPAPVDRRPTTSPTTPAGTAARPRADIEWRLDERRHHLRPRARARGTVRRLRARRRPRPGPRRRRLVRHRRPRPRRRRRTTWCSSNAPPSRSGSRASSCRSRSSRTTSPPSPGITDHALWKRKGALVDDEVVLYAVADPLPLEQLRADASPSCRRSCGPSAVARVAACRATPPRARCSADCSPSSRCWNGSSSHDRRPHRHRSAGLGRRHGRPARARRPQPVAAPRQRRPDCRRGTRRSGSARRAQVARRQHRGARRRRSATACTAAIVLNSPVGGANPDAVEVAARLGGRVVWMPTVSAPNHKRGASSPELSVHRGFELRAVEVVDDAGRLLPELARGPRCRRRARSAAGQRAPRRRRDRRCCSPRRVAAACGG